jgi:hypothetical protein
MFTDQQKQVLREMVKRKDDDGYEAQLGANDDFALEEIANFKALRLSELAVDQQLHDASLALYNSV